MFIADPDIDYETIYEVDTYAPQLPTLASQMIATLILEIVTIFWLENKLQKIEDALVTLYFYFFF